MGIKSKLHIAERKLSVQRNLEARVALLKSKGMDDIRIQKDSAVKMLKAEIRHANRQLSRIADQEKLNQEKTKAKAGKAAGEKQPQKGAKGEAPKPKKEKKAG
jgi:hypothetical protein